MKKVVLVIVALLVFLLALGVLGAGGAYMYAQNNEAQNAFTLNLGELTKLSNTAEMKVTSTTTGQMQMYMSGELAVAAYAQQGVEIAVDEEQLLSDQELVSSETAVINVLDEKVTITADGEEREETLEEYREDSLLKDEALWERIAKDQEYEVEETELNGEKVWKYTITSSDIKATFEDYVKDVVVTSLNDEGLNIESSEVQFEGNVVVTVYIGREDYEAKQMIAEISEPINVIASGSVEIPEAGQSLGFDTRTTISEFTSDYLVESITLKEGKSMPGNPLVLMLAIL